MQRQAPPQYSPDGRWWWDGSRWLPVEQAEVPRRRMPTPWIGLAALLLLALLSAAPSVGSWLSQWGRAVRAPAAPVVAPGTVATPDDAPGAARYRQEVAADEDRFQAAATAVADACAPAALGGGTDGCRASLQSMDAAVGGFEADLDAQQPPSCLKPADTALRASLALYHLAIQRETGGLDERDVQAVVNGAATMAQATGDLRTATSLLSTTC